ncbi:MAG: hypothetical protein Kow0099_21260 [Candidatus Abyssubacteria bacterium]
MHGGTVLMRHVRKSQIVVAVMAATILTWGSAIATSEAILFSEDFRDSALNLIWLPFPGFSQNHLTPIMDPSTPEGDVWAGRQTNAQLGGFASLSYTGARHLKDYTIEAWVYTIVVPDQVRAPLNGIAVRVDPDGGRLYRLASHFDKERRLTFAYVGRDTQNYPVYLRSWEADDIPGGVPAESGWHKMAVRCIGNRFLAFWDDKELPGGPIEDDRIPEGFFGVYVNYVGGKGIVETRVDGIKVTHAEGKLVKATP